MVIKTRLYIFLVSVLFALPLTGQDTVVIHEQRIYKTVEGTELVADMFYTSQTMKKSGNPAIGFFHGGGWAYGTPSEFYSTCRRYARKGFITFSFDYRLSVLEDGSVPHPEITPVECVKDARSALRWIRENASGLHINPEKIVAGGQSAGGQLALSTALIHSVNEGSDNLEISPVPNAILTYSGTVNTMEAWADRLLGDRREEIWSISPHHNLKVGLPPTLAFHGDKDCMVPLWTVKHFKRKSDLLNNNYELIILEGRSHYLGAGNDKYATYYDEGIMERTDQFLERLGFVNSSRED